MGRRWRSARGTKRKSPLASITSAIEYVSDPHLSRSLCLLGRSQRRGEKSKKNTDLWEVNCHSSCSETKGSGPRNSVRPSSAHKDARLVSKLEIASGTPTQKMGTPHFNF